MKDVAVSVLARLKNQAKENGLSYQMCLQLFCQEEFLRKLSLSRYNNNFILKGGFFIYTLTEFQSRATQDIDFLMCQLSNNIDKVKTIMEEISHVATVNDYITVEVLNAEMITPDKEYQGISIKFVGHIKQVRVPFSIDIGIDDVIVPKAVKRRIKTRLADFDAPEIYTYSLESTIAEKFDSILKRMEATSRMKDFFDIYYLSNIFDFEGRKLQEAVWKTIQHRGTAYETNYFERIADFENNSFLLAQWMRFQPSMQMQLPEFKVILYRIKEFLQPVFESLILEREFFMEWSAEQKKWLEWIVEKTLEK
ncbi:nucleotidyl transferase AbiEii/AbiGii toxin family protein [Anaerosporobacter sp.]|uniref:nucleotidyl transferase AbiEii/AbiGii toxin family protein n=1 Tax=Anaerosporobacter sp. TaxID=1872529 RepID=UPI002F4012FE